MFLQKFLVVVHFFFHCDHTIEAYHGLLVRKYFNTKSYKLIVCDKKYETLNSR